MNFSFSNIKKLDPKYDPKILSFNHYNYDAWYKELDDKKLKI